MSDECRHCRAGLEHCHGTLIRHREYAECTEEGCPAPLDALHEFSVECEWVCCRRGAHPSTAATG